MTKHMSIGREDVGILVGGEQEVLVTENGKEKAVVLNRNGFVKIAIKHGYHLVPSY